MRRGNSKISAIPYVISFNSPLSGSAPYYLHFDDTKFITVRNNTPVSTSSNPILFGFTASFLTGNYIELSNGESFSADFSFKDFYAVSKNVANVHTSIVTGNLSKQNIKQNLLVDGNMESGSTSVWEYLNFGVTTELSKVSGSVSGGGSVKLSVKAKSASSPSGRQSILTGSKRYRITGWATGDGTYKPAVNIYSAVPGYLGSPWIGVASTGSQYFDFTYLAPSNARTIGFGPALGNVSGSTFFYDDLTVTEE